MTRTNGILGLFVLTMFIACAVTQDGTTDPAQSEVTSIDTASIEASVEVPPELGVSPRATCTSQQGDVSTGSGSCRAVGGLIVSGTGCASA